MSHPTPTCITGEPCATRAGCYCKNCREYQAGAGLYPPCPDCGERTYYGPDNMPRCPDCYDPDGGATDWDALELQTAADGVYCPACDEKWDYDCNGNPRCACSPPCPCCDDGPGPGAARCMHCNAPCGDDVCDACRDIPPNDVDAEYVGPGSCAWCGTHAPLFTFTSGGCHTNSPYVTARLRAFCGWSCHRTYHS